MIVRRLSLGSLIAVAVVLTVAAPAQAQATRTWVSGVGDDVNPCSRTAPCKTFAGAISKTAAGGEISVLDPGGYGALTITKAITINGRNQVGSVLAAATTGFIVNAGNNDVVILRDLDINGAQTGVTGIRYLNARALHVQNVDINGFRSASADGTGIRVNGGAAPAATPLRLYVSNSSVTNCEEGITIQPTAGKQVRAVITDTTVSQNENGGIFVREATSRATLRHVTASGNIVGGVGPGGADLFTTNGSKTNVESSTFTDSYIGIRSESNSTVKVSNSTISDNIFGLDAITGGQILSRGNNTLQDNDTNGAFTGMFGSS